MPEIDCEFFDEPDDALGDLAPNFAGLAADARDGDSWQRLGDVIGRLSFELDAD